MDNHIAEIVMCRVCRKPIGVWTPSFTGYDDVDFGMFVAAMKKLSTVKVGNASPESPSLCANCAAKEKGGGSGHGHEVRKVIHTEDGVIVE